ncbi:hypothetical protein [Rubritalea marina]|uniref:hypothetical protein n=1 Tax=Rubritalea marina TaxID=361055 RepID=UPI0012E9EA97|nr:hypothetical protein [Rubritalea marina]
MSFPPFFKTLLLSSSVILSIAPVSFADELDDLLSPEVDVTNLEDASATQAWKNVVNAFRKNDMEASVNFGEDFLNNPDYAPNSYQVLGVNVMLDLAKGTMPHHQKNSALSHSSKQNESRKNQVRAEYAKYKQIVATANAKIDKLTFNRTRGVQQGTKAHRECVRNASIIAQAEKELAKLKSEAGKIKRNEASIDLASGEQLKKDTLRLLDLLIDADEVEAAFAICNVYTRSYTNDLDIAQKQKEVIKRQKVIAKATKIAAAIRSKMNAEVAMNRYWSALEKINYSLSKVQTQITDREIVTIVERQITPDIAYLKNKHDAANVEAKELGYLARRDARQASLQFNAFSVRYPDYPNLGAVETRIMAERSDETNQTLKLLVSGIEDLAKKNPQKAFKMLESEEAQLLDSVQRQTLVTTILSSQTDLIDQLISDTKYDLKSLKDTMGGGIEQISSQYSINATDKGGEASVNENALITYKVDNSAELPEIKAGLQALTSRVKLLQQMDLSPVQIVTLTPLLKEADLLNKALQ